MGQEGIGPRIWRTVVLDAGAPARAKQAGERLGSRDTSDVSDAHVICCAVERDAVVVTSEPDDMEALTEPGESLPLIAI